MAQHNLTEGQILTEGQKLEQLNRDGNEAELRARLTEDYQHLSPAAFRAIVRSFDQANESDRASGVKRNDGTQLPDVQFTDDSLKQVKSVDLVRPLASDLGWKGDVPPVVDWVPSVHNQFDAQSAGSPLNERDAIRSMPHYPDAQFSADSPSTTSYRHTYTDQSLGQRTQRFNVNGQIIEGVSAGPNSMSGDDVQQILDQANQRRRQNGGYGQR